MVKIVKQKIIKEFCNNRNCIPTFYGKDPSLVIMGESHGNESHDRNEQDLIQLVKPEYVLHELFDARTYNLADQEVKFIPGVPINWVDEENKDSYLDLVDWAEKYRFNLIGMDLSFAELQAKVNRILDRNPPYEVTNQTPEVCRYRETRMANRMVEYLVKTKKPVVAIMGNDHRKPCAAIHPILKSLRLDYATIFQRD